MVDSPSGGVPAKAPRWDLANTEGCSGGVRFSWCSWMFSGYVGIYRRKKYVEGRPRGPRDRGRALGGWTQPPPSWAPRGSTDLLLPPVYIHVPREHPRAPRKPNSTAATFCIREIPSWSLHRRSTRGGIDHGGPLHHLQGLSDEL